MGKGTTLNSLPHKFQIVLQTPRGTCYKIPLLRGGLWPEDGGDPPPLIEEMECGMIESSAGNFSNIDQFANHFGCIIDYQGVVSIDDVN